MPEPTDLEALLEEERRLIRSGALARLEDLAARKQALVEAIAADPAALPPDSLRRLAERLARNNALLGSAARGLRAAAMQVREARQAGSGSTYGKDGHRRPMQAAGARIERRL